MEPYYEGQGVTLFHGDCREVLAELPDASVDSIVTDPPYELGFMGKGWDASGIAYDAGLWAEALRVLKPGGHLLAFGGTRTWHRLAVAIEDAGFEIRDSIAWMYGSGFPKSRNLDGNWQGWGTALKPAHEPIVVARKPLTGTVAANVLEHGTGALNIDGCRIPTDETLGRAKGGWGNAAVGADNYGNFNSIGVTVEGGRWPANVVLDEDQAAALDQQSGTTKSRKGGQRASANAMWGRPNHTISGEQEYDDEGGASRFFYVAKAPARERPKVDGIAHPTVKPLTLMRWLCRLVTPPGGVVLEPFAGSGTTVQAALAEGFRCIAVEREDDYLPLILSRLTSQEPDDGQLTLDASA